MQNYVFIYLDKMRKDHISFAALGKCTNVIIRHLATE